MRKLAAGLDHHRRNGTSAESFFLQARAYIFPFLACLFLVSCATYGESVRLKEESREHRNKGIELQKNLKYQEAAREFGLAADKLKSAIETCTWAPDCKVRDREGSAFLIANFLAYQAYAVMQTGDLARGQSLLKDAFSWDAGNSSAHMALGFYYVRTGDMASARKEAAFLKNKSPEMAQAIERHIAEAPGSR